MRLVGIPVALFVIVAVPVLVAQQNDQPAPPTEAKLTVRLSGDQGGKGHPFHIRVRAAGKQPFTPSKLVDSTGLKTASVVGDAPNSCLNAEIRDVGNGHKLWCLKLSDVAEGAELSGVASGPGTKLTLTVTRRHSFVWLPLLVLIAGLIVAVVGALAPKGLRRFVRRVALARLLESNRSASADQAISGLDAWVATQLARGSDPSSVFSTIDPVVRQGPDQARSARQSLSNSLAGDPLGARHPFAVAALAEAVRTDHRAEDFLQATGKLRAEHPANEWLAGLDKMKKNLRELNAGEQTIVGKIQPGCRSAATRALNTVRVTFTRIMARDEVSDLDGPLDTLSKTIDETLADPACRLSDEEIEGTSWWEGIPDLEQARGVPATTQPLELEAPGGVQTGAMLAVVLTIGACLAVVGFAGLTVEQAAYNDKPTFASFHDYFTLFSAALASGAAAAVISLLAYWRPDPPASTS
jgi:hypothetical protein